MKKKKVRIKIPSQISDSTRKTNPYAVVLHTLATRMYEEADISKDRATEMLTDYMRGVKPGMSAMKLASFISNTLRLSATGILAWDPFLKMVRSTIPDKATIGFRYTEGKDTLAKAAIDIPLSTLKEVFDVKPGVAIGDHGKVVRPTYAYNIADTSKDATVLKELVLLFLEDVSASAALVKKASGNRKMTWKSAAYIVTESCQAKHNKDRKLQAFLNIEYDTETINVQAEMPVKKERINER